MRVETIMTEDPVWVDVTSSIGEVIEKLLEADVRHLPVLDDGVLVGIVSDRDLRSIAASVLTNTDPTGTGLAEPISMIMTSDVFTTTPDSDVKDVVDLLIEHRIGAVPVVDPGQRQARWDRQLRGRAARGAHVAVGLSRARQLAIQNATASVANTARLKSRPTRALPASVMCSSESGPGSSKTERCMARSPWVGPRSAPGEGGESGGTRGQPPGGPGCARGWTNKNIKRLQIVTA